MERIGGSHFGHIFFTGDFMFDYAAWVIHANHQTRLLLLSDGSLQSTHRVRIQIRVWDQEL